MHAHVPSQPNPAVPEIEPTHQIAFPGGDSIYDVQFSPDGRTAYCMVDGQSINLWHAGLNRCPIGACLTAPSVKQMIGSADRPRSRRRKT